MERCFPAPGPGRLSYQRIDAGRQGRVRRDRVADGRALPDTEPVGHIVPGATSRRSTPAPERRYSTLRDEARRTIPCSAGRGKHSFAPADNCRSRDRTYFLPVHFSQRGHCRGHPWSTITHYRNIRPPHRILSRAAAPSKGSSGWIFWMKIGVAILYILGKQ